MMRDKRKALRRQLRYTAWISLGPKEKQGCTVADVSESGARLGVEDSDAIPDQFVLLLAANGSAQRKCRVIWRAGEEIGVEFEKAAAPAAKPRTGRKAGLTTSPPLAMPEPEADEQDATESTESA